jgi:hypothetical protein
MKELAPLITNLQTRRRYIESIPDADNRSEAMQEFALFIPNREQRRRYIESIPQQEYRQSAFQTLDEVPITQQELRQAITAVRQTLRPPVQPQPIPTTQQPRQQQPSQLQKKIANLSSSQKQELKKFECPIPREIMHDPVVLSDGYSYERKAIQEWLRRKNTSPMTNLILSSTTIIPNRHLRSVIQDEIQSLH